MKNTELNGGILVNERSVNMAKNLKQMLQQNRTLIMGILNVTPDSFSDGGEVQYG